MPQAPLRLRLIGPFTVDGPLTAPVPDGKARRALAVLAERPGEFVPVGELVEALWDGDAPDRAGRNVAALVSRLRRAIGRDRIDGTAAGYRLVRDDLWVDLVEAVEHVEAAERELALGRFALVSTSAALAARRLELDVALAGETGGWVAAVRLRAARYLRRARIAWACAALELGTPEVAVDVAGAALLADPLDEEACRAVMTGRYRLGGPAEALAAYRRLEAVMSEQLGSDPSPATQRVRDEVARRLDPDQHAPEPAVDLDPIVGREAELARLRALWLDAAAGDPALVVVTGEAGMGRSTLVERFAAEQRCHGALVLAVSCFEAERSLYLQPLVQVVRTAAQRIAPTELRVLAGDRLGTLTQLVPELGDVIADVGYERAGPELEHSRTLDALAGFLTRLGARRPVLVTVDDAHHAGSSTIAALQHVARNWAGSRIMIVVSARSTHRDETRPLTEVARAWLELGPLAPAAVATLIERSGRTHDAEQMHAWTGGSPLYVTELLRQRAADGEQRAAVEVPLSLQDTVAERIALAGEDVAQLLAQAAVFGLSFAPADLAALSGLGPPDCTRLVDKALRAGLLHATRRGSLRFANDVVRQVAYESAPTPVRISRHRRAARLFDARPESAARHYAAAGDWASATTAWIAAAHTARLAFANTEAVELLSKAVGTARSAGDVPRLVEVLLVRGRACMQVGWLDEARADHEHALELARGVDDADLEARALEELGWTALHARDAMAGSELAGPATQLAESAAAAPGALPSATLLLGRVRHWDGDYAGAGAAYQQVLDSRPDDTTTAVALAYQGALLQHLDRFAEAKVVLARAAALCRRTGEFRPLLQTLFFTALARGDSGDFAGALQALARARALVDAERVGFYRAGIETATSWIWQELGQVHRARDHAETAVDLARRGGGALELEQELHALLAVADCDLLLGRDDDAAAAVDAAAPTLDRSLPFKPRAHMRFLEMRSRWAPDQAEALLVEARLYSSPKYEALALAALGRPEEAATIAGTTRSDLVVGQLGAPAARRAALGRIAASLPAELRESFDRSGRLTAERVRS